jgi:hypothetical protein
LEWPKDGLRIADRPEGAAIDGSQQLVAWRAELVLDCPVGLCQRITGAVADRERIVRLTPVGDKSFVVVVLARGSQDAAAVVWEAVSAAYVVASGDDEGYAPVSINNVERVAGTTDWH